MLLHGSCLPHSSSTLRLPSVPLRVISKPANSIFRGRQHGESSTRCASAGSTSDRGNHSAPDGSRAEPSLPQSEPVRARRPLRRPQSEALRARLLRNAERSKSSRQGAGTGVQQPPSGPPKGSMQPAPQLSEPPVRPWTAASVQPSLSASSSQQDVRPAVPPQHTPPALSQPSRPPLQMQPPPRPPPQLQQQQNLKPSQQRAAGEEQWRSPALAPYGSYASPAAQRAVSASAAEVAARPRKMTRVWFWLTFHAEWGQRLKVVGSHENLGKWVLLDAPELSWTAGDRWKVAVELPAGAVVEYKYVLLDNNGAHALSWQAGNNSVLAIKHDEAEVEVFDNWGGEPGSAVMCGGVKATRENRLLTWASEIETLVAVQRNDLRRARMELVSAQENAKEAREEAKQVKAELAASEAERLKLDRQVREMGTANRLLRTQLAQTTISFREAMETAQAFLAQAEASVEDTSGADGAASAAPAAAVATAGPSASQQPSADSSTAEAASALHQPSNGKSPMQAAAADDAAAAGEGINSNGMFDPLLGLLGRNNNNKPAEAASEPRDAPAAETDAGALQQRGRNGVAEAADSERGGKASEEVVAASKG